VTGGADGACRGGCPQCDRRWADGLKTFFSQLSELFLFALIVVFRADGVFAARAVLVDVVRGGGVALVRRSGDGVCRLRCKRKWREGRERKR
jgi:hypothetical protein